MISFLKKSLNLKIIITLVIVLALSFSALSAVIVSVQNSLLGQMMEKVNNKLISTENNAAEQFSALEANVRTALQKMGGEVTEKLSNSTAAALSNEEKSIRKAMEGLLKSNAEAVSNLLASVAATPIMDKQYDQLKEFSKSVAQTEEILFAFFLDDKDNLLPGYVNLVDDRVLEYLENGKGETEALKVLDQAEKDADAFIHEKKIEYFGIPLGKSLVCISTESVANKIEEMGKRFDSLRQENSKSVQQVLQNQSESVTGRTRHGEPDHQPVHCRDRRYTQSFRQKRQIEYSHVDRHSRGHLLSCDHHPSRPLHPVHGNQPDQRNCRGPQRYFPRGRGSHQTPFNRPYR